MMLLNSKLRGDASRHWLQQTTGLFPLLNSVVIALVVYVSMNLSFVFLSLVLSVISGTQEILPLFFAAKDGFSAQVPSWRHLTPGSQTLPLVGSTISEFPGGIPGNWL